MAATATSGVTSSSPTTTARLDNKSPMTTSAARGTTRPSRSVVAAWSCLLLSEEEHRREALRGCAEAAGWEPIACGSIVQAVEEVERWRTQLAIVDLGSMHASEKSAYLQLAARLASRDRLLLICDEAASHETELHARQAGAWLYVPSPELGAGMTELLGEARQVARKLSDPDVVAV